MAKNTHVNGVKLITLPKQMTGVRMTKCEDIEKGIRNKQNVSETTSSEIDETPTPDTSNHQDQMRESVIESAETSDHPQPQSFDTPWIVTTGM